MASYSPTLTSVQAVLSRWQAGRERSLPRMVPVLEAVGCVLAADLAAPGPVPAFGAALRPGHAVAAADTVGVSAYAPLVLMQPPPWVDDGDRLPPGTDAVLAPDAVLQSGRAVEIVREVAPGENVRREGEDLGAGDVLRRAGQILRPLDAAVAMAAGIADASVRPFTVALAGERRNAEMLEALRLHFRSGMRAHLVLFDSGDAEDLQTALTSSSPDMILVAAPETSRFCGILNPSGVPGAEALALGGAETALVGSGQTPFILAPPRLDALVPLLCCLVAPYGDFVTGREAPPVWRRARLAGKIASQVGLTELALVRETKGGLEPLGVGSITLASLAAAEGFLVVPPESEGYSEGAEVEAYEV